MIILQWFDVQNGKVLMSKSDNLLGSLLFYLFTNSFIPIKNFNETNGVLMKHFEVMVLKRAKFENGGL